MPSVAVLSSSNISGISRIFPAESLVVIPSFVSIFSASLGGDARRVIDARNAVPASDP